jgi:hypothetical protein
MKRILVLASHLALGCFPTVAASMSSTTLHVPGSYSTRARSVDGGNVVGWYENATGPAHGFLYDGTSYTTIDVPGAAWTHIYGIDGSNMVGYYEDSSAMRHGFLFDGADWTTLDFPGADKTGAYAIEGTNIVGVYYASGTDHGFLYDGTTWTALDYPEAMLTYAMGISGSTVVGLYLDDTMTEHGFMYDGATWTSLDFPGAYGTGAVGVSGGKIVGYYRGPSGLAHSFLYDGATWTPLDDMPGSNETVATDTDCGRLAAGFFNYDPTRSHVSYGLSEPKTGQFSGFVMMLVEPVASSVSIYDYCDVLPDEYMSCCTYDYGAPCGVAQAGTTWIGYTPSGSGLWKIGAPGYWDFDDRGGRGCPIEDGVQEYIKNGSYAQGWTSEDVLAQKGLWWHAEDYAGVDLACSVNPITGSYSAWCGKYTAIPGECFSAAPGYGHDWSQWLCRTVTLDSATPSLAYDFNGDTQPGFDYCYVIIDEAYSDSCGWVDDSADTLRCYDGCNPSGSESINLSCWDDGSDCDILAFDSDYSGDSVKVCFVVVTDGTWDDEDGMYDTCDGAFTVDNIVIDVTPSSGGTITTDFETGTLEGWTACGGWSSGDYVAVRDVNSFINNSACEFGYCDMTGCVLTFYNPMITGQYGNGGHYAGRSFQMAWSPTIDMTSYGPRGYVLSCDCYSDLPIENGIFYRLFVSYVQDPAHPAGAWSPALSDDYAYYAPTPRCAPKEWSFSQYVPADADSIRIGIGVWNGCDARKVACTNGNESPIFDNVRVGVYDLAAPMAALREVDNYTDAFPEGESAAETNTALIDVANNTSRTGAFIRLGDSLVVHMEEPSACAELCFKIVPGPGTNLSDPFFTTWFPGDWDACTMSDVHCARMDTAFLAGNGIPGSQNEYQVPFEGRYASMFHEEDARYSTVGGEGVEMLPDSLFTPGTTIYYLIRTSYLPCTGPYNYLPFGADPNDVSTMYEVNVLPDFCKDPLSCLLYVDYCNSGAQVPIENALALLGRTWDRFDLRGAGAHEGNGIGNRKLGPGKYRLMGPPHTGLSRGPIGPSLQHLAQYKAMLLSTGNSGTGVVISDGGTGTPGDPTNDVGFMEDWINEGTYKGLWLNGTNIATDFATATWGPKPGFLQHVLATQLVSSSYREASGHPITEGCRVLKTRSGEMGIQNTYSVRDSMRLTCSSCPTASNNDCLFVCPGELGVKNLSAMYDMSGLYASVDHIFKAPNAPYDTVRTKIDGFSVHNLRNLSPPCGNVDNIGIALWIRDVLGGNNNKGYFYDAAYSVQYCPSVGVEDPILDAPGGPLDPGRRYVDALFQNYPNPFRRLSGTTIHYTVKKASKVEIRIFDVAGRLVRSMTESAELGDNYVTWDGKTSNDREVASGVYFYELKTGGFRGHKKMLVLN